MKPICPSGPSSARHSRKRSEEKGVALVTVLAIVLLMTVLIMSFFTMASSELTAAKKDTDNLRVRALADAAVNMVIGQIREATTSIVPGSASESAVAPWSSQPGGIRVYNSAGDLQRIYKLYSSSQMYANSLRQLQQEDIRKEWDSAPAQWVDMNAPVVVPDRLFPDDLKRAEVLFPIADPRARRARSSESVEGFDYSDGVNGVVRTGENSQRLPMPVRWLYILADGSVGFLDKAEQFIGAPGSGQPSKENPIVGRVAFWTDDETCKVNVNTASEGVYWDTPRASTDEDLEMGIRQPKNGEFQRYPGHPATVCMSSVLFPNRRWTANGADNNPTGSKMSRMDEQQIQSIWRMAPYIYGEKNDGSFGGREIPDNMMVAASNTAKIDRLEGQPNPKHLYTSYDDYLIASTSDAKINGSPRDVDVKERQPADRGGISIPVDRLQQARFFLTTRSSGPEITLFGTPRLCLWPMDSTDFNQLHRQLQS